MNKPTKEEIRDYMELHNADEVGINNQWTMEESEYYLLLSDKYNYEDFTSDKEKMRDFNKLTKVEFLKSYSYITEEEYHLTAIKVLANKFEQIVKDKDKLTTSDYQSALDVIMDIALKI